MRKISKLFTRKNLPLLAVLLLVLTHRYKKIHPVAFLAASAVIGMVFHFAG